MAKKNDIIYGYIDGVINMPELNIGDEIYYHDGGWGNFSPYKGVIRKIKWNKYSNEYDYYIKYWGGMYGSNRWCCIQNSWGLWPNTKHIHHIFRTKKECFEYTIQQYKEHLLRDSTSLKRCSL